MSSTIIDAKLRITAEERASAEIAKVVKTFRDLGQQTKVSAEIEKVTRALLREEQALRAVSTAASAQSGLAKLQADLHQVDAALKQQARALDAARQARAAFEGVKVAKGSEQAQQASTAAKAVREAGAAYRAAEHDVRRVTAAIAAQTTTVQQAERAAAALGHDVTSLATAEQTARTSVERTTSALRQQIQVEDQAAHAAQAAAAAQKEAAAGAARAKEQALRDTVRAAERAARDQGRIAREEARDLKNQRTADAREQRAEAAATARQRMRWAVEAGQAERRERQRSAQEMHREHLREAREHEQHMRRHGLVGTVASVGAGAAGVHGVFHAEQHALKAGAEVQSTRVDMQKAGIPAPERAHIEGEALQLAAKYRNVTQAGVMELWKEMRSVMTDPHEVDHVIDPMVRAKSLLDARDSTGQASHGLNMLVKGAENIGAAKDPERFVHLLDGYMKAMQVMGKTITPEGIYEMQKYSKTSGARWSDRFTLTTAQSLAQEMGGSTAGNSVNMVTKQIVGGMQNLHSKAQEFARVGLIDEHNLDRLKTGEIKGVKKGVTHAVHGDDLAASDLDKWVYEVMLPALEKSGIKSQTDQLSWVQKAFTGTGADVITKLIMQRESFEAHARMYGQASGLDGQKYNRDDASAGVGAVTKALETFAGVVTSPVMKDAGHVLDSVAGQIGRWSLSLEAFNQAHPTIAKAEAPVAGAMALGGAGATSVAIWKLLNGGFGLKGSALALNTSAAALDAAAFKLGGGKPADLVKNAVPEAVKTTAPAAVTAGAVSFGLGGITIAGGAVAGAYLDSSDATQGGMGAATVTGGETTGQRLIREHHAAIEQQKTLQGQVDALDERIATEKDVSAAIAKREHGGFWEGAGQVLGLWDPESVKQQEAAGQARIAERIAKLTAEREALEAKIKALGEMPAPPRRPVEVARTPEQILGPRVPDSTIPEHLAPRPAETTRTPERIPETHVPSLTIPDEPAPLTLGRDGPRFGLGLGPDAVKAGERGQAAGDALAKGFLERLHAGSLSPGDDLPGLGPAFTAKAGETGTEAGQRAGQGVASGVKEKTPEVVEEGRLMFERLRAVFLEGIKIPIGFAPGAGADGSAGKAGVQNASEPAERESPEARTQAPGERPAPPRRAVEVARTPEQILGPRVPDLTIPDEPAPLTLGRDGPRFGLGLGPDAAKAGERGQAAGDAFAKGFLERLHAGSLSPGDDLPGLGPAFTAKAGETGTEAGQRAGQGVADGVKEKTPDVVEEGRLMFERLRAVFLEGIKIPIGFTPGEAQGGIQKASFDPDAGTGFGGRSSRAERSGSNAYGGSIPRGGSLDGAGSTGTRSASLPGAGSGGASAVGGSAQDRAHRVMDRLIDRGWTREASAVAAGNAVQESGARSDGPLGDTRRFGRGDEAAHGLFQWRGPRYRALRAFAEARGKAWTDFDTQVDFFDEERKRRGGLQAGMHGLTDQDLANRGMKRFEAYGDDSFGTRLGNARGLLRSYRPGTPRVPSAPTGVTLPVERLRDTTGLDGKEGIDLGNGTIRMPDGRIRSRTYGPPGVTLPDKPPPGPKVPEGQPDPLERTLPAGGALGGRGDMQSVALDLREAVDGLRNAGWRSHHTVEVTAGPGTQARTTGMRATASGPMRADVGVSMPQTKATSWDA